MKKLFIFLIVCSLFIPCVKADAQVVNADDLNLAPNAKSVILLEPTTGEIIYQRNVNEKLAPASMTKIMTLLLIMENLDKGIIKLGDMVTVSANASSMGGSQILLETGEKMSVDDLIKGIAIASGNDITVAKKQ